MSVNPYFSPLYYTDSTADQTLVEDLIIEMIQIHGTNFYYLPRTLTNFDSFFGEDQRSAFNSAYQLEFFIENSNKWLGPGNVISPFGLEIKEDAILCCSIKRFEQEVPILSRPKEGDIIVYPRAVDNQLRFFEIMSVDNEEVFYELGKIYVYKIYIKTFEYSNETVSTGIASIDDYQREYGTTSIINLQSPVAIPFMPGETVTQTGGYSASVVSCENDILIVTLTSGDFDITLPLISPSTTIMPASDTSPQTKDTINDNQVLDSLVSAGIIDNSEINPLLS